MGTTTTRYDPSSIKYPLGLYMGISIGLWFINYVEL